MFPASAIGKKPTISAKTHDLKNKIFLGALTKTGADGDDHLAFFFTWPSTSRSTTVLSLYNHVLAEWL